jgi:tyrosine-protein phosphatase YwqE
MKTNLLKKQQTDTSIIYNGNNQFDSNPIHRQYRTSLLNTFNPTMYNIIETPHANIEKRTQQIIAFQNTSPRF